MLRIVERVMIMVMVTPVLFLITENTEVTLHCEVFKLVGVSSITGL